MRALSGDKVSERLSTAESGIIARSEKLAEKEAVAKAAAWLWYMRGGCSRTSSSSSSWLESWWGEPASRNQEGVRRESRFKAEAAASKGLLLSQACSSPNSSSTWYSTSPFSWDSTESQLSDSFDLSFSDRLTRTLSSSPSITSSSLVLDSSPPQDDVVHPTPILLTSPDASSSPYPIPLS
eukprot:c16687_g1_i1 orf=2-541(-)